MQTRAIAPRGSLEEAEGELFADPPWISDGWMMMPEESFGLQPPKNKDGSRDSLPEDPADDSQRYRTAPPVDLRESTLVPQVRDQGETLTCSAFALAGLIEHAALNNDQRTVELATGWLHNCLGKRDLNNPVFIDRLRKKAAGTYIPILSKKYPEWRDTRCDRSAEIPFPILETQLDPQVILSALNSGRPIATCMIITENFRNWDQKTKPYQTTKGDTAGEHAIMVVGYTAKNWICRNSYGVGWGDEGYFYVEYGQCELMTGLFNTYVCPSGYSSSGLSKPAFV